MTAAEDRALAADERTQELGPADAPTPFATAPGFVHATNPDGIDVVFTPGESLPKWAVQRLPHATADKDGVLTPPRVMPAVSPHRDAAEHTPCTRR